METGVVPGRTSSMDPTHTADGASAEVIYPVLSSQESFTKVSEAEELIREFYGALNRRDAQLMKSNRLAVGSGCGQLGSLRWGPPLFLPGAEMHFTYFGMEVKLCGEEAILERLKYLLGNDGKIVCRAVHPGMMYSEAFQATTPGCKSFFLEGMITRPNCGKSTTRFQHLVVLKETSSGDGDDRVWSIYHMDFSINS